MGSRLIAVLSLAAGLAISATAQLVAPLPGPPLYDGVSVQEPYRYLAPEPGQAGNPTSFSGTQRIRNGASSAIAAATAESPPQAQLIAPAGAFAVPTGTTELRISIAPVVDASPDGIVGNAYRIAVTDHAGASVPLAAGSSPTLVLRAPQQTSEVAIVRLVGGSWQQMPTQTGGQPDVYLTNVEALGDYAIRGAGPSAGFTVDPWLVVGLLLAILVFGVVTIVRTILRPEPTVAPQAILKARIRSPRQRRRRR
jgi:hypothetical protein